MDSFDKEIIEHIDSLTECSLLYYTRCYSVKHFKHYMEIQRYWMEDCKYYAGLKLNRSPSQLEIVEYWNYHNNAERFRAYYVLRYPENVEKLEPEWFI